MQAYWDAKSVSDLRFDKVKMDTLLEHTCKLFCFISALIILRILKIDPEEFVPPV